MKIGASAGALACVLLVSAGCSGTDRSIDVGGQQLVLGTPIQVQPPGSSIVAFSPDGSEYAVAGPGFLEVRSYSGRTLARAKPSAEGLTLPMMFDRTGRRLVQLRLSLSDGKSSEIAVWDWTTGQTTVLATLPSGDGDKDGSQLGFETNAEGTIFVAYDRAVTTDLRVVPLPQGADSVDWALDGSLVVKASGGWTVVSPDGSVRPALSAPIVGPKDRIVRGQLSLALDTSALEHRGAHAYIGALWVEHSGVKTDDQHVDSALVGVAYDPGPPMLSTRPGHGFVPGHDAVYYHGDGGSFIVEYTFEDTKQDDSPSH